MVNQCEDLAQPGSLLEGLGLDPHSQEVVDAKAAFGEFADWLTLEVVPQSSSRDGVGRDRYERFRGFSLATAWIWMRPTSGAWSSCGKSARRSARLRRRFTTTRRIVVRFSVG